ncbi:MAG TPA: hypothetical protein VFY32_12155, partial [Solirubrobacteraceae bacterium]|nr:hypothetical protein [Solirubrobacteraceae bacterium]
PGIVDWSAFHEGIGQEVHSHYATASGVLIDPMPADGELPGEPRLVVLTNRHHLRHATDYGCPIRCHQAGLHEFEGIGVDVEGFAFGDEVAPGVRALEVGVLCPEETALHLAVGDGFVALADAIVRAQDGGLAFVPDFLLGDDPQAVKTGLRDAFARLLEEEAFDGLLLAHGAPTASGGRAELQAFVTG